MKPRSMRFFAFAFVGVALAGQLARAAEVATSEADGTVNDVIVEQGSSTPFNISLSASGAIGCAVTSASPSTAKVHTAFSLSAAGALTSGTFSAAKNFYRPAGICTGQNGTITWDTAPAPYSIGAVISTDAATPLGDYTITLSVAAGTTAVTNQAGPGGKLADSVATSVTVHVVAPPPPPDSTPPVITASVSPLPNAAGWNNATPVTVSFTVVDGESPIAAQDSVCTDGVTFLAPTLGTDVTCSATSAGGTASETVTVKIDTSVPNVLATAIPGPNGAGWNNTDVAVSFSTADDESGVASTTGDCAGAVLSAETAGTTLSCSATNGADLEASDSVTVKIDKTAPAAPTATVAPEPNAAGWNNTPVAVSFTSNGDQGDVQSGVDSCSDTVHITSNTPFDGSSVSGTCTDLADNEGDAGNALVKVDLDAPDVSVTGVTDGETYSVGSVPAAGCSTEDALSGVETSATVSVTGAGPNGTGVYTATCSGAADVAGNSGSDDATYTVNYGGVSGILAPLDRPVTMSRGRSVPVKWRLAGDEPAGFSTTGWTVTAIAVTCSGEETGGSEPVPSTSSAGLRYDASADQYVYNGDFRSMPVGSCWKVRVTLNDPGATSMTSSTFRLQR